MAETLAAAYRYCDRIARRRAGNFYPAFLFLPRRRRLALSAFYAFCALSDDIADNTDVSSDQDRQKQLANWEASLDRCFAGQADSPVFLALSDTIQRFQLPPQPFYDLLKGIAADLNFNGFRTFADLEAYCRWVASSVGLISVRIFGCTAAGADDYADRLGIAFQLTNILRDVAEDVRRGRIYLPRQDLLRFSYSEDDLRRLVYDQRYLDLMNFEYDRARLCFQRADPKLAGSQAKKLLPAEIMKAVYFKTLEELRLRQFRTFAGRISLPWWRKGAAIIHTLGRQMLSTSKTTN